MLLPSRRVSLLLPPPPQIADEVNERRRARESRNKVVLIQGRLQVRATPVFVSTHFPLTFPRSPPFFVFTFYVVGVTGHAVQPHARYTRAPLP